VAELHCPLCDERVSPRAIVCPHCGAEKVRGLLASEHKILAGGVVAAGFGGTYVAFKNHPHDDGGMALFFVLFAVAWVVVWVVIAIVASFRVRWIRATIK